MFDRKIKYDLTLTGSTSTTYYSSVFFRWTIKMFFLRYVVPLFWIKYKYKWEYWMIYLIVCSNLTINISGFEKICVIKYS